MEFNENKLEQMGHGIQKMMVKNIQKKSAQIIKESKTVQELGILTSRDVSFAAQSDDFVLSSNIEASLLLRTFNTREAEPVTKLFNSCIRSMLDYCSLIWNSMKKEDMD